MSQFDYKQFYTRNRPHIHPPNSILFITFRLAGSVPKAVLNQYKAERIWFEKEVQKTADEERQVHLLEFQRRWFRRFEEITDRAKDGPMWLAENEIRQIVIDKMIRDDGSAYRLDAFCIMSNHIHLVIKPNISERNLVEDRSSRRLRFVSSEKTLATIMQGVKGSTAYEANKKLGRQGPFWEKESYDRYVRDDAEFHRVVKYTLNNPVKAGLISDWREWPGNYLAPRLKSIMD